jgi:two-component system sensor histidine kinase BaeS
MRSLRFRLIFNNLLPVLIILPLVGILIIYLLETQGVVASVSRDLNQQAILVADTAGLQDNIWVDRRSAQAFLSRISPRLSARVMLLDTGGRMLVSSDPADEGLIGKILFSGQYQTAEELERKAAETLPETDEVVVPVVRPDGLLLGFVRMDNPLSTIYQQSLQLRQVTIWVVIVGVFLGIILGWLLSRDLSTQLQTATQAVTGLATGQSLELLDDTKKPQEIARLYQAFNTLTTRLRNLEENRKRLLANLVHEIGRPLGSLQSAVQALSGGAVKDRELRTDLLEGMSGELHRLDHLVGELANLHNELAGTLTLNRERVAIGEWLQKITEIYGQEAKNKGLQWECLIPSDLPVVNLDADQLTLAVQNLISNAIRYTPAGEKVSVLCGISEEGLIISVMDTGPGIAVEEQQRIFEPFTRGSSARRFSQGMGLGLTIAREMIEAHGGRIELISDIGKGSEFRLILPVEKT